MGLRIVNGNLLDANQDYICQQNNCISVKAHGLSEQISKKFGVNPYSDRKSFHGRNHAVLEDVFTPGTTLIYSTNTNLKIICMFAQYGMGKPYMYGQTVKEDSYRSRLLWFNSCLSKIGNNLKDTANTSLAFPWGIGCGLAGGDWERDYYPCLYKFSIDYPQIEIVLYKL